MAVFQTRIEGLDTAFRLATLQGEVAGIQLVQSLIPALLDDLQADITIELEKEREGTENG